MIAREMLVECICTTRAVDNWLPAPSDYELADAILAKIRENITLEWEDRGRNGRMCVSGPYTVYESTSGQWHLEHKDIRISFVADTEEAAKAAALEHYRDTIMAQITRAGE